MATDRTSVVSAEEMAGRIFSSMVGAFDLFAMYLGDKLGYYRSLDSDGPATPAELAKRTGASERYTREWLEQQAVTGMLEVDDPNLDANERTFSLPVGYADLFTDPNSLTTVVGLGQIFAGTVAPLDDVIEAYKTGAGVPYALYGQDLVHGQAAGTRPLFVNLLAQEWIPSIPEVHERLSSSKPARVADIGMGVGWSSLAIARGYPNVRVDGFDLDEASVQAATENAIKEGLADRVTFQTRDVGEPELSGLYDLALAFECIHDMSDPVAVLSAMRRMVEPNGIVLIVDERAEENFAPWGSEVERLFYGFSILHCLPVGMADQPSAETGAVMRTETFERYAREAGFADVAVLPIENDFFRFYRLTA